MFLSLFLFSEKADWEKKLKTSMDTQKKLEEQKQTDVVKIQEFEVSRTKPKKMTVPSGETLPFLYPYCPLIMIVDTLDGLVVCVFY